MPLGAHKAAIMGVAGVSEAGSVVLLTTTTLSGDSAAAFTSQLTSTYQEYIFGIYLTSDTDDANLQWQVNADGESGYNETIQSTFFYQSATEAAGSGSLQIYTTGLQQAGTSYQRSNTALDGSTGDSYFAGWLHLFNPASTTYVKHFQAVQVGMQGGPAASEWWTSGYIRTAAAITGINWKMSSGEMTGKIKLWGVL